jgi:TfoX/Sxy family transcriptional regulator of competence genes
MAEAHDGAAHAYPTLASRSSPAQRRLSSTVCSNDAAPTPDAATPTADGARAGTSACAELPHHEQPTACPVNTGEDTLRRRHTEAVAAQQQRAGKALSPALDDPGRYGPGMELLQVDTLGAFSICKLAATLICKRNACGTNSSGQPNQPSASTTSPMRVWVVVIGPSDTFAMAYDQQLAQCLREHLDGELGVTEKRMFGGLAFLVNGNMAVSASGQGGLMVRVDPAQTEELVSDPHVRRAVMRGREMDGWLRVDTAALRTCDELLRWVRCGVNYAGSLPPK